MHLALPALSAPRSERAAPRLLFGSLALGVATQALFFRADLGLSYLVFVALVVTVTFATLGGAGVASGARFAAGVALVAASAVVLRRGAFATSVGFPLSVAALLALPSLTVDRVGLLGLGGLPMRLLWRAADLPSAFVKTAALPRDAAAGLGDDGRATVRRVAAGLALGLPVTGVFVALLSADSGFSRAIGRVEARTATAAAFTLQALACAVGFALAHAAASTRAPAPEDAGVAPSTPYRRADEVGRAHLSPLTFGIVLAQVALVFLVFVFVRRDSEFVTHEVVHARGGFTYAGHLHAGFHQLIVATLLAVGLVALGHRLVGDTRGVLAGGRRLAALEATLLALTAVALGSCVHRLRLYVEAYGATPLRAAVGLACALVAVVLLVTLVVTLSRRARLFGGLVVVSVAGCLAIAAHFDVDGWVARQNLDRAARGRPLDEIHLTSLSSDACVTLDHPFLRARPELAEALRAAWRAPVSRDLRSFRGLGRC